MPELIWEGKYNEDRQLAAPSRVSLPFQTIETVNQSAQERQMSLTANQRGASGEWRNRLIWGDKKYVLPSLLEEFAGKVDLIYIDPPFATGADFSYKTKIPNYEAAGSSLDLEYYPNLIEQIAYRDTWGGGLDTYIKWMYETLVLLRELLSESGSIYVHCDDTASHYLKLLLDELFGSNNFVNEISWHRSQTRSSISRKYRRAHDVILFFGKSLQYQFEMQYRELSETSKDLYNGVDARGYYQLVPLLVSGRRNGETGLPWRGVDPNQRGRDGMHWVTTHNNLDKYDNENRIHWPDRAGGAPRLRYYLDDNQGVPLNDFWDDVALIHSQSTESLSYPTQKPEALIERMIKASSNEGDLVLDCFVGSGTMAAVAENLGRRWIAADMSRFAISTTRKRLLSLENLRPFHVQNLGRYERQAWQGAEFNSGAAIREYRDFILKLYRAEPVQGYEWLHGARSGRMVHVGEVDAPVAVDDVHRVADEFSGVIETGPDAPTVKGVDILGWDFGLEVDSDAQEIARNAGINIRLLRIPREVMDQKAVDAGDVQFFELASLSVKQSANGRELTLTLDDFSMPLDGVPDSVRSKVTHWSQWIDYWAVDWDYQNDTFNNQWQSYRTRQNPTLIRAARRTYDAPGSRVIVVKVIDILGNDTTRRVEVTI